MSRTYHYRSGWGLTMLRAAGYVESPRPGIWRITARGRELLAAHPRGFDDESAKQVIRESQKATSGAGPTDEPVAEPPASLPQAPDELIDAAVGEIEQVVAAELLDRIRQAPPAFFEPLVLDLLHRLGYGASAGDIKLLGGAGDGGVDGVIALDRLSFEKVSSTSSTCAGSTDTTR